jgi:hypothetical protein
MAIPISTTTISILRGTERHLPYTEQDPYGEGYGTPAAPSQAWVVIASGIRAVIGAPGGSEKSIGGQQAMMSASLIADPCDCTHTDRVMDEYDGTIYNVVWTQNRGEFGITRTVGEMVRYEGTA